MAKVACPGCGGVGKRADRCAGCWTDKCNECTQCCPTCNGEAVVTPEIAIEYFSKRHKPLPAELVLQSQGFV